MHIRENYWGPFILGLLFVAVSTGAVLLWLLSGAAPGLLRGDGEEVVELVIWLVPMIPGYYLIRASVTRQGDPPK